MDPPQLLTSELDIGVGTLQVTSVIFDGFPVAKGSCIVGLSLNGEKVGMIVEGLGVGGKEGLECKGLSFELEGQSVVLKNGYVTETMFFARIDSVFAVCPLSERENRTFWPSFILFIQDGHLLSLPSPDSFVAHSFECDMANFLNDFFIPIEICAGNT